MFSLKGKTAVVTGGASGIGKAISEIFARQGATVHILELNENAAIELKNSLNTEGGITFAHACDVASQASVKAVFDTIESLDILVNNAGVAHIGNVENTSESDLEHIININIKGVYNCLQAALPLLKKSGGGSIVNMASIAALVGLSDRFAYSMSKGAVYAMTLSVAKDYLKDNIRCNSISPARVHTPFVDGFLAKTIPIIKRKCLKNCLNHNRLGAWQNLRRWQLWHFIFVVMKRVLLRGRIIRLMAGL